MQAKSELVILLRLRCSCCVLYSRIVRWEFRSVVADMNMKRPASNYAVKFYFRICRRIYYPTREGLLLGGENLGMSRLLDFASVCW